MWISISKNAAGMLESLSLRGMNGLNAVIVTAPGNAPSRNENLAIGNSPRKLAARKWGAADRKLRGGPDPNGVLPAVAFRLPV